MTRYRDRETGQFVSRSTWKRSKAHDGTRYKRETRRVSAMMKEARREAILEELEEREEIEEQEVEYAGAFDSP